MLATLADKKAVADGVLDRVGELTEIKLRGGREAMVARPQQILAGPSIQPPAPAQAPTLPADRAAGFAAAAAQLLDGVLRTCEETYPREGAHTVIRIVVERDASSWQPRIESLHERFFASGDPLAPVQLQVIERATEEALQQLAAARLIAFTTRASRPLFPASEAVPALSPEQQAWLATLREQTARKLKMARALGEAELWEEARAALLEAIRLRACALAIEHRLREPEDLATALQAPLAQRFGSILTLLREFAESESAPWLPVVEALG